MDVTRECFLSALGCIYLAAFLSLAVQIKGLVGANGILPAVDFLSAVRRAYGKRSYRILPTIFWFSSSDRALLAGCIAGAVSSVLVIGNFLPAPALIACWILYLSLTVVGQDFLSFQWDILLIETGFIAIFFALTDSAFALWTLWWLFFRLNFESGVVKLTSGDQSWRDLTALDYHYESQPLPTWTAWYAHRLPSVIQRISCLMMFLIEIGLPFLVFTPFREVAFWGTLLLQVLILATGNYTFFNFLTIVIGLSLLIEPPPLALDIGLLIFIPHAVIGLGQVIRSVSERVPLPSFLNACEKFCHPLHVVNSYGLFRVMTKGRREIIIEGSNDGREWTAYEFRYKPGDVNGRPRFVEPHQPRLDWQMWFAALTPYPPQWFQNLMIRLLLGSGEVTTLLKHNPFAERPPRYVRALLYDYRFGQSTWWNRQLRGTYFPASSLK